MHAHLLHIYTFVHIRSIISHVYFVVVPLGRRLPWVRLAPAVQLPFFGAFGEGCVDLVRLDVMVVPSRFSDLVVTRCLFAICGLRLAM